MLNAQHQENESAWVTAVDFTWGVQLQIPLFPRFQQNQ